MSLNLDDRQRAMLAEMGVRVWWPAESVALPPDAVDAAEVDALDSPEVAEVPAFARDDEAAWPADASPMAPEPVLQPPIGAAAPAVPRPAPVVAASQSAPNCLLPLPDGITGMDWARLQQSVAQCQACAMCLGRRAPVLAALNGVQRADWFIVGEPPDDAQERAGQPFVDDAGRLLDNMLKAVGVRRWQVGDASDAPPAEPSARAYLSLVLKCRPALPGVPDAQALAACANYLRREIALVQPKVIVAMGRLAMQVLLSEAHPQGIQLPLGKLRGQVWRYQDVPVVVSYPPAYLLRQGQDKGRAWEDLCLARAVAQGTP